MGDCNQHSCKDCSDYDLTSVEDPCRTCSHGGMRYVKGASCNHTLIHNKSVIERNQRTIRSEDDINGRL